MMKRFEEKGYDIQRDIAGMRTFIINKETNRAVAVSDDTFLIIGEPQRDYTHDKYCKYHEDHYDNNYWSFQLPQPPICDCPYEELPPITEEDIEKQIIAVLTVGVEQ